MSPVPSVLSFVRAAGRGPVYVALAALFATLALPCFAQSPAQARGPEGPQEPLPRFARFTSGLERHEGLLTFYTDADRGRVWLELPAPGEGGEVGTYIYLEGLLQGLGSNPVGLDRGQLGDSLLLTLRRLGGRLLFEQPAYRFRALSEDPLEQQAVRESFATSVIWAAEVAAQEPDGRFLVELTSFLVRDAHDVVQKLRQAGQGSYALDTARSAVDLSACLVFPDNLELEAVLTYGLKDGDAGPLVRETSPSPASITLVQHHSFVRLPAPGYAPRKFDPRSGGLSMRFLDYGSALSEPLEKRWVLRHRLKKRAPSAPRSPAVKPLVFYLDRGTPEPVRSALLEGASWWQQAFEAAGFEDAFRVELAPPDLHPLDARYNFIQWVHRSTRGWSYGGGVIDPRTGEMIKAYVTLGSLRVRQDRLLFEGLLGAEATGSGGPEDPVELSLARLRQLAAHEVGHALGLTHNFAASINHRASVMDYPAPWVRPAPEGGLDASQAYGVGIGAWDELAIRYLYSEVPEDQDEDQALTAIIQEGLAKSLLFVGDADARPAGAAHPLGNLWDNGSDPLSALEENLEVRRRALARFGVRNLPDGQPLALLEEVLVPLYFHHRYQLEAAVKLLGGVEYAYALKGDGQESARPVPGPRQRAALAAVLKILEPEELDLPERVLRLVLPRPDGYEPHPELFAGRTAPLFDPLAAAATASQDVVAGLLQPQRAARMVDLHRRDASLPGFSVVLEALEKVALRPALKEPSRLAEIRRAIATVVVQGLLDLARDPQASPAVQAEVRSSLERLHTQLGEELEGAGTERSEAAHAAFLHAAVERFLERPESAAEPLAPAPAIPPGSPIGASGIFSGQGPGPEPEPLGGCSLEAGAWR